MVAHLVLAASALLDLTAHHGAGDVTDIRLLGGDILDHVAVAHDDHLVADGEDLLQAVGDEDDGDAAGRHAADGVQQSLRLLLGEDGGGLVEDQQTQILLTQLAGDLGKLLMADGHIADDHFGVDGNAHLVDGLVSAAIHFLIVESVHALAEHF